MSNELAIAATTTTLVNLLTGVTDLDLFSGADISARPLDVARDQTDINQLNLFLYKVERNAAWTNRDMPQRVRRNEVGQPLLPLTLSYLLTAYGQNDNEALAHGILGRGMNILHDRPLLSKSEIETAVQAEFPGSDLHRQVERVRLTLTPMSLDDMNRLWGVFQTEYRLSVCYEASVVLIESQRTARAAPPVLSRGPGDSGIVAQADMLPAFPTLTTLEAPDRQPALRPGETLVLRGHHLGADSVLLRFHHKLLASPNTVVPADANETEISAVVPNLPAAWPPGLYRVDAVLTTAGEDDRISNGLPLLLAPVLDGMPPAPVARDGNGDVTLTLNLHPQVRPEQDALLLLGDRLVPSADHPLITGTLSFPVTDAQPGEHFLRVRIDGTDSLLVNYTSQPPAFDTNQRVTIT